MRVALPQADGKVKLRPAVLLRRIPPFNDWLLCAISTQLHNEVKGLDILLDTTHPDFPATRLKYSSLIRVGQLFTMPEAAIEGKIGSVSSATYETIVGNLTRLLHSK